MCLDLGLLPSQHHHHNTHPSIESNHTTTTTITTITTTTTPYRLPKEDLQKCMEGLIALEKQKGAAGIVPKPTNFLEWLQQGFGQGILDCFLVPYNRKVWGYDPSEMNTEWMGERVATVDLARITSNILSVRVACGGVLCVWVGWLVWLVSGGWMDVCVCTGRVGCFALFFPQNPPIKAT
jgi:hypothetical protein